MISKNGESPDIKKGKLGLGFNPNNFKIIIAATLIYLGAAGLTSCVESDRSTKLEINEAKKNAKETENLKNTIKIYENILKDFLKMDWHDDNYHLVKIETKEDNTIKVRYNRNGYNYNINYIQFKDGKNVCLDFENGFFDLDHKIHIHREGSIYLVFKEKTLSQSKSKNEFVYNEHGNRIDLPKQIRENEATFLRFLQQIKGIKEDDKPIFAAILSSMQLTEVDYIEKEGYFKIFGEDNEAAHEFMIAPSKNKNGGYWGIITKMGKSAKLQTAETDGSSKIYAFTIDDESTPNTKRFKISLTRIVQDLDGNVQKKFGETSNTKRNENSKDNFGVGGIGFSTQGGTHFGFASGENIMKKGENVFTKTFLSEWRESFLYTLKHGEFLKLNGRNAYSSPAKFQKYYISEHSKKNDSPSK